jgi:DNA excision repair protein ERCC-4
MKIIIDTREQTPLTFERFEAVTGTLQSGDYSIQGLEHRFAIERKSIPDLVQSLTTGRERFERELHRLRGFDFKRLLIVGTEEEIHKHEYRSKTTPKSVLHSLNAFEVRYDIPVVWGGSESHSARLIERWAFWYAREIEKTARQFSESIKKG